jgi:hypothetical protein
MRVGVLGEQPRLLGVGADGAVDRQEQAGLLTGGGCDAVERGRHVRRIGLVAIERAHTRRSEVADPCSSWLLNEAGSADRARGFLARLLALFLLGLEPPQGVGGDEGAKEASEQRAHDVDPEVV